MLLLVCWPCVTMDLQISLPSILAYFLEPVSPLRSNGFRVDILFFPYILWHSRPSSIKSYLHPVPCLNDNLFFALKS